MRLCACGCGQPVPLPKGRGGVRKYIPEHARDKRVRPERAAPRVLKLKPAAADGASAPPAAAARSDAVTAATSARLTAAERLSTPEAAVALHLARLIDEGDYNAQGAAALAKSWSEALGRA